MKALSTLSRMFDYARFYAGDARENFTTEALAGAIRHDAAPMLLALSRRGVLDRLEVERCVPFTQRSITGAGVIDLVLQIERSMGAQEIWVEVKVHAAESGDQLTNYRTYIDAHSAELTRELVVISRDPLLSDVPHIVLRWRDVVRAAQEVSASNPVWSDLVDYLEEIGMSDRATYPITLREAGSLEDASALLRKAMTVLLGVNGKLLELGYPDWMHTTTAFSTPAARIIEQFRRHGRFMLYAGHTFRATIFFGFVPVDGEVHAAVWIEANPKRTAERVTVRNASREALDASWDKPLEGWQLAVKTERAISFRAEQDAVDWFVGRLAELRTAGLVDLLPTLGTIPPEEEVDLESDARTESDPAVQGQAINDR